MLRLWGTEFDIYSAALGILSLSHFQIRRAKASISSEELQPHLKIQNAPSHHVDGFTKIAT